MQSRLLLLVTLLLAPLSCGGGGEAEVVPEPAPAPAHSPEPEPEPEPEASAPAPAAPRAPEGTNGGTAAGARETGDILAGLGGDPFAGFTLFRDDVEIDLGVLAEHAGTAEDPVPVDVDFLGVWEFNESADPVFPPYVSALDGRVVRIQGFMLPGVDFEHIKQFHLVRSLWGCCFGAPPRINEIVRVTVPGKGLDYTYNTLVVTGTLRTVLESVDGVVEDLYRLEAVHVAILDEFLDPGAPAEFNPASGFEGVLPDDAF